MKLKNFFLVALILLFGNVFPQKLSNKQDQIIKIKAERIPEKSAPNVFQGMYTKDGRFFDQIYPKVTGIPDSLKGIIEYYFPINNVQALYQGFKAGKVPQKDFDFYIKAWGVDTIGFSSKNIKTHVVVISGTASSGKKYYFLDTNNNYSFADEKSILLGDIKTPDTHKILFERYINGKISKDSTWIAIREMNVPNRGNMMLIHFSECTTAFFQLGSMKFNLTASPPASPEYKNGTSFEITDIKGVSQKLKLGELFKANDDLFSISCSQNGLEITLNRVLKNEGGTQVGMAPIAFSTKNLKGETVNFPQDFKGKYVLLDFWSTSCAPCIREMKEYYINIYRKYGGKNFEIIGVADNTADQLKSFMKKNNFTWITIPDGIVKTIQGKYRIYQYPTMFMIDPNGIILTTDDRKLRDGKFEQILQSQLKSN